MTGVKPKVIRTAIRSLRRALGDRHPGERCWSWRCVGRRIGAAYSVPDEVWEAVIGDPFTVRCLACFDREAEKRGVPYFLAEGDIICVTWSDWVEVEDQLIKEGELRRRARESRP